MMPNSTRRARILIVEDSLFEQRLLADLLSQHQYQVMAAFNGRQGYEVATSNRPDLILLDVRMPCVDGFAACRLLKANPATAEIPVIFISGAAGEEERVLGLTLGGVDFVRKPFSDAELAARIQVHLSLVPRGCPAAAAPGTPDEAPGQLVHSACRLIDDDLANVLALDAIAAQLGTYREKLSHLFREQLGTTVFTYIRDKRIARSAELLRDTDIDVRAIALMVGFRNAGNFATAFRERMGIAPSAYRKANAERGGRP